MLWTRYIILYLLFLLGRHLCFPSSPRYLELADSADFFIARENWNRAEEKIIEALRLEPANFTNSLLLSNLGLVQTRLGKYNKALESLSLGLNIAPSSTVILNNRAHTYLMIDSVGAAIKDLDRSLSIDSIQEWTLQTRGFLYLDCNEPEKASLLFEKLRENFKNNSSALAGLASVALRQNRTDDAKKLYLEALNLNPDDNETRQAYIFLLIKNEEYTDARIEIKTGLTKDPEDPVYYLLRGYLHRLNYRPEEAQADKRIAISKGLDPKYVSNFIP